MSVVAGVRDLYDRQKFVYFPDYYRVHGGYKRTKESSISDIALIHLPNPIRFIRRKIEWVQLNLEGLDDKANTKADFMGWGYNRV